MRLGLLAALALIPPAAAATLAGRIVAGHTGSPLASVNVQVHKVGQHTLAADLETDLQGRFEAEGLPEGEYRLEVSKPNYLAAEVPVRLAAAGSNLFVRLVKLGVVTGRVTDRVGQPVRGAIVFAMPKPLDGKPLRPKIDQRTSYHPAGSYSGLDPQGNYRLHSLPPGEYAIAVSYGASTFAVGSSGSPATDSQYGSGHLFYPDNARPRFLAVAGGEEHRNIDFAIITAALHTVSGKVELPAPKQRFLVGLTAVEQPAFATAIVSTSDDGTFKLPGVPPGSYHLFAAGPSSARNTSGFLLYEGAMYARSRIEVSGEDVANLSISPQPGHDVNFALRTQDAGCPASAQITLTPLEDWGSSRRVHSQALSTEKPAKVESLGPTRYAIAVSTAGDACYATSASVLDLTSGSAPDPFVITLVAGGSIRGKLITGGRPVTEFVVMVVPLDATQTGQPSRVAAPERDARFAVDGLRPGKYRIGAVPAGAAAASAMSRMFEIDVYGGSTLDVDLAPPPEEKQP